MVEWRMKLEQRSVNGVLSGFMKSLGPATSAKELGGKCPGTTRVRPASTAESRVIPAETARKWQVADGSWNDATCYGDLSSQWTSCMGCMGHIHTFADPMAGT